MKRIILAVSFLTANLISKSQCENDLLGYNKANGNLTIKQGIRCYLSEKDTATKAGIGAFLIKGEKTKVIIINAGFLKSIGTIDQTTALKLIFQDGTFITINEYPNQTNSIGLFIGAVIDKYSLLLLKTKIIAKVEITGDLINQAKFQTDVSSINFLSAMDCLEQFL